MLRKGSGLILWVPGCGALLEETWDIGTGLDFLIFLGHRSALCLAAVKPPSVLAGNDEVFWRLSQMAITLFDLLIICLLELIGVPLIIWRMESPQSIRCLLWLAAKDRLLTTKSDLIVMLPILHFALSMSSCLRE
ncbi:hypothetical protein CRG98_000894 [Punica granatum]|uniref:Uncharacterized protein n=1 Tax=Punica granatum TaxID=22663 RepID=A0A2I0LDC0_PUNGR|nr:hypothetical protein CRG98_000894 [Punica granatum]